MIEDAINALQDIIGSFQPGERQAIREVLERLLAENARHEHGGYTEE